MAGSSSINAELSDAAEDTPLHPSRSGRSRLQSLVEFFCCRNSRDIIMALIACLGAMSMGFCLGYSSPALQDAYLMKLLNNEVLLIFRHCHLSALKRVIHNGDFPHLLGLEFELELGWISHRTLL